jgi:ribonuclease HII
LIIQSSSNPFIRYPLISFSPSFGLFLPMLYSSFGPDQIEAGLDEAGRGCLAGPVVAAAVILPKGYQHPLLKDSKKLSARQREKLRAEIGAAALAVGIGVAEPAEIDQANVLQASLSAMHRAVAQLALAPELLLVDGKFFRPYPGLAHECIVRGDGLYLSIAAASVVAKTYRDELMRALADLYPPYGWAHNAGYPTAEHYAALAEHGATPYHRRSFRLG